MTKELLVNVSRGEEVRVALVEDGRLEEIYLERDSAASNVGNIYLGKVTNVEGSIQAAFVDFGYGRNGFLHVQDLHPDNFPQGGRWDRMQERVGKKIGRRDRPPIQDCLRRGDQIVVQIIKEGIGTKGPTLTSYPSIPGRFLVMMPGVAQMGVSKNIEDEEERRRLRKILDGLKPPKDVGFIIRTAGMGKTKTELERDFKYLTRLHEQIETHKKHARPPTLLYSEGDLVTRTVRDVWSSDVDRVVCDDAETALRIKQFFKLLMPRTKVNVQLYQGEVPLFHAAGIEQEIETMFSRHVNLPSGGSLVIDSTEAAVTIDVNSGKFREHDDAEETAYRTDMEAADEICRQLRLRDLGGVVIVDFIDLRYSRHRETLFNKLTDLFKQDKAKSRHLPMNEFGIVAITRQRMRPDLKKSVFMACPTSRGTGFIKTPESMALDVMRRLRVAAADERVTSITVRLYPTVALHVLNTKRQALADLERRTETQITLRQDETLAADDVFLEVIDERGVQVQVDALQPSAAAQPAHDAGRRRRRGRRHHGEEPVGSQAAESAVRPGAQIDLPNLMELGELKLEEVERLVNELGAEESAAREAARKDPQKIILEALRSGSLFEDESAQDTEETTTPDSQAATQAPEPGPRGRRRRGRGRDRDRDNARREPAPVESRDAATPTHVEADDAILEPARETADTVNETAAGDEQDGSRRRRRRRRGRRGRGRDGEESGPPQGEPVAEQPTPYTPDDLLDARVNGNRADRETHMMRRDPFTAPGQESSGDEAETRRRRRRKGRGLRGHLISGYANGPGARGPIDASFDGRINGSRPERKDHREAHRAGPPQRDLGPGSPPPAQRDGGTQGQEEGGGRRRRRRGRRRGREGAEMGAGEGTPSQTEFESGGAPGGVVFDGEPAEVEFVESTASLADVPSPSAAGPDDAAPSRPARRRRSRRRPQTGTRTSEPREASQPAEASDPAVPD